ncbi:ATP-binding protein [Halorubrum lipolyticum]|uniref:Holliday junction DNA helicase n=1 Tax=Halorubrum lipolyticum DSM 21995 TaxID=1227482 RepID=M0NSM3_9EURY|nr:ATP-binding protein [Halorubrum lipolyticum]EMA59610.1 holliday junction DNA helicase [Halorubrum lipolyticum DSM 21995]
MTTDDMTTSGGTVGGLDDLTREILYENTKSDLDSHIETANRKVNAYEPAAAAEAFRKAASAASELAEMAQLPARVEGFESAAEEYRSYAATLEDRGMDAITDSGADPNTPAETADSGQASEASPPTGGAPASGGRDGREASERGGSAGEDTDGLRQDALSVSLESPDIDMDDVGGMYDLKQRLMDDVAEPIQRKDLHQYYGVETVGGVVLQGPPGTGKTHVTRAFAGELGWNFIELSPAEVVSALVGEGARNIREVFEIAKDNQPCLIFFDEIDNIAKDRSSTTQRSQNEEAMLTQLLTEMTALDDHDVVVFAATNQPAEVDEAVFNAERFSEVIEVPRPDAQARPDILRVHLRKRRVPVETIDFDEVAERTAGFSAADMKQIARGAAQAALRKAKSSGDLVPIRHEHVLEGIEKRRESVADRDGKDYLERPNGGGGGGVGNRSGRADAGTSTGGDADSLLNDDFDMEGM